MVERSDLLRDEGWKVREISNWKVFHSGSLIDSETQARSVVDWIGLRSNEWAQEGRGRRNGVFESPVDDEEWFAKQYHHGGLFAGDDDVYYTSGERFLDEVRATLKARRAGVASPEPRLVLIREDETGYQGFYVSRYLGESSRFSRVFRRIGKMSYLREAAGNLAELHDAGIDHRDYHVENLRVDAGEDVVVTDFDPVAFETLSSRQRSLRVRRFNRSLLKYGFLETDAKEFRESYEERSDHSPSTVVSLAEPLLSLNDTVSDLLYWAGDRDLEPIDLEKILVRVPNWLGDTVMSLPYIQKLAGHDAVDRVDVAVRSAFSAIYEAHDSVEAVWELPNDKSMSLPDEINTERYSSLIIIPKSLRTGYQAFRTDIPRRIGFATQGRGVFLTDRVPLDGRDRTEHHARLYMRLTESITDPDEEIPRPDLRPDPDVIETVREKQSQPFFTIHPGTAYGPAKRWPPEQFTPFLGKLLERRSERIVALGVEDERDIARRILDDLPDDRVDDRVGETTLEEAMGYLTLSEGTVANDSGIMHLSAALGTPTLGIFGSSSPELTEPLGPRTDYLYEGVECSPCFEEACPLDEDRYKCLERIDSDDAKDRFLELIDRD